MNAILGALVRHRATAVVCTAVTVVAALLRLTFVAYVHAQWETLPPDLALSGRFGMLTPDSFTYLEPARALLAGRVFDAGSLARPPGYPLFLALLGTKYLPILVAQALLGATAAGATALLTCVLTGRLALAMLAGGIVGLSPTGIGVTGLVIADLLLGTLVILGMLLLAVAARRRRPGFAVAGAVVFGAASLVKPVLLLWAPLSLLVLWLFSDRSIRFLGIRSLTLIVGLQVLPLGTWSVRNLATDGVLTPSSIGTVAMREYLAARTEAWVAAGQSPTPVQVRGAQTAVRERFRADGSSTGTRLRRYRAESRAIARAHPCTMLRAYVANVLESLRGGWDYFPYQLPMSRAAVAPYLRASAWEARLRPATPWILLLALLATGAAWRTTRAVASRQSCLDVTGLLLVWGYFVALGGITFWTGPRLLYPAQPAAIVAAFVAVHRLLGLARPGVGAR